MYMHTELHALGLGADIKPILKLATSGSTKIEHV